MPRIPRPWGLAFKLILAFVGVSVVGVALVAYLVGTAATSQFLDYLGHSQMMQGGMGQGMGPMMRGMMGRAEQDFLSAINRSLWTAGIIAAAVAFLLGLVITRQIVAPLQQLSRAARRIASGDLSQRVTVTSRDETGELASSFNAMAEALARNEQARRNLVADIAHELRTPLSIIQGNLEAMRDGVVEATPQNLASLHGEALLLHRLVDDLGTLSLADAGQLTLHPQPVDIAQLIQGTVRSLEPQARGKSIALSVSAEADLPAIRVDADRIAQVLRNLLSNALRHTPPNGTIQVNGRAIPEGIQVSVSDTGPGIPPGDLPHIFQRFYRVDRSRARATGGAGIGLAVVKELVEAHGGKVWAESTPGKGSTFYFSLP